jgi:hypothetical protein
MSHAPLRLLALAALSLLGACNVVLTQGPLFKAADEAGAPAMRPGVWLIGQEGGCRFDERAPIDAWPDCAGGAVVKAGEMTGPDKKGKGAWEREPFVLAAGDPRIIQMRVQETLSVDASAQASGGGEASASASGGGAAQSYGYAGARPVSFDAQGQITSLVYWPVMCGPPPPRNAKGEEVAGGTQKPLPGMDMKPGDPVCTTTSTAALRGAAKASKAWTEKPMQAHWVRDGAR